MPTADPSNVIMKIAHPDLYERNPFNLLNLPVNATARDIRRRKEDIEAAFEAGTEADEFRSVLPIDEEREPPTREAVDEAFAALEDPEMRMAYALFWFWPASENIKFASSNDDIAYWIDNYGERMASGWRTDQAPMTPSRCHNLAVMHHMKALATEQSAIAKKLPCTNTKEIDDLWDSTIDWWNAVTADADLWHSVAEMVSALNDPRLNYRFARSLRDQFAFAFDQINVELAIDFAKAGRESDAKRQVKYMKLSQPDADDVEGTFDDAFSGLLRQTEAICKASRDETDKNPNDGLHQANLILEQTDEPLRVSRIVLETGASVRNSIVTTIFSAVRSCLVAYGNKTNDWDGCLKLCEDLKSIAETPEQEKLASNDYDILAKNKQEKDEVELCWFCRKNKAEGKATLKMHGDICRTKIINSHHVSWKTLEVSANCCGDCADKRTFRICILVCGYLFIPMASIYYLKSVFGGLLAGGFIVWVLCFIGKHFPRSFFNWRPDFTGHPVYEELKRKGWSINAPSPRETHWDFIITLLVVIVVFVVILWYKEHSDM